MTGTNKIIQTGDTTTLTAKLPPKPGTVIEDQTIYLSKNVDSTDWSLNLTASKEIIQVGETTTLTMLVKDSNDNAKENIVLNLYKVDDSMAKELVATLVTDSTGMASYNYVGVGAGLLGFIAESGILLSETYSITDGTFYDKALDGTGNHNDNWANPSTKVKVNRSATGTTLTMDSGVTWGQLYAQSQSTYFDLPFAVELKSLDYSDTPTIRFANESSTSATHILTDGNWKISFNSDSITVLKDGESQTHYLNTLIGSTKLKVYLELSADTDMLKYKDFVIYPI